MIRPTPDSSRLLIPALTYAGEAPRGQALALPHGALISLSGLPALLPRPTR